MVDDDRLLAIPSSEYDDRVESVRHRLTARGVAAVVLVNPARIAYLTGFHHVHTERPIALVVSTDRQLAILAPRLEQEHIAAAAPGVERIDIYSEYPGGDRHPLTLLASLLADLGLSSAPLICDNDGYHDTNGYQGPTLSMVIGQPIPVDRDVVDELRMVKSQNEQQLLRLSASWGNQAFELLRERIRVGEPAADVAMQVSVDAARAMRDALGPSYRPRTIVLGCPVRALVHRAANTALPHGLDGRGEFQVGDVLDVGTHADVGGYLALFGRTMFLGEPSTEFARYFGLVARLQEVAFAELIVGRPVAAVEKAVQQAHHNLDVAAYHRHHVGHGLGIEMHERPYLDLGATEILTAGMVVTVEPGIYVPGVAGFRHADTVLITADGPLRLTPASRDLDAMTLAC